MGREKYPDYVSAEEEKFLCQGWSPVSHMETDVEVVQINCISKYLVSNCYLIGNVVRTKDLVTHQSDSNSCLMEHLFRETNNNDTQKQNTKSDEDC